MTDKSNGAELRNQGKLLFGCLPGVFSEVSVLFCPLACLDLLFEFSISLSQFLRETLDFQVGLDAGKDLFLLKRLELSQKLRTPYNTTFRFK
ncbi:MAG: hypothetical protein O7E52_04970 [Candidatus Poribacteria bacterium]|nr:hypothetical protein [Candidatus Poribacteria bacterium]